MVWLAERPGQLEEALRLVTPQRLRDAAVRAGTTEDDIVARNVDSEPARDPVERLLERIVLKRLDATASLADNVMVMLAVGVNELETGTAFAHLEPLDEPCARQNVQSPIHAGDPDPFAAATQLIEDLLRRQAAVLLAEQLDDGRPRAAGSIPVPPQRRERMSLPVDVV